MKRNSSGGARTGLAAFALWGTAIGAMGGCMVPEPHLEPEEGQGLGTSEQAVTGAACPETLSDHADQIHRDVHCYCDAAAASSGSVAGTDLYAVESSLCRAAVHAGAITAAGGQIRATIKPIGNSRGSTRNGVVSSDISEPAGTFMVEGADPGDPVVRRYVPMAFHAGMQGPPTSTSHAAAWRTSFTIHNPSPVSQIITVKPYDLAGTLYTRSPITLAGGRATSFQLNDDQGTLGNVPFGFKGAVVLEGTATFEVTAVQVPVLSSVVNRPIVNAESRTSGELHFPTVMKVDGGRSTRLFFHNPRASSDTLELTFRNTDGTIQGGSALPLALGPRSGAEYDLATVGLPGCQSPCSWTGALTVRSTTQLGRFVGAALQVDKAGTKASAYEGIEVIPGGWEPLFPSALRSYPSPGGPTSSSIVLQNLSDEVTTYVIGYYPGTETIYGTIPPRGRKVIRTLESDLPAGFLGSAAMYTTLPGIAALTEVTRDDGAPSFEGVSPGIYESDGMGGRLSLPYVRWTNTNFADARPRTHIAVQNLDSWDPVPVKVTYFHADGSQAGMPHVFTIPPFEKRNSSPLDAGVDELGYAPYGASAIVEALNGSHRLGVLVRASGTTMAEDYTGIPIPRAVTP